MFGQAYGYQNSGYVQGIGGYGMQTYAGQRVPAVAPFADAPFRATAAPISQPAARQIVATTPFIAQTNKPGQPIQVPIAQPAQAAQADATKPAAYVADDPAPPISLEKDDDEQEELDIAVEMEIHNLEEAKAELAELHGKTVELANKWHQAKSQLERQEEKEAEVRELVAAAEAEIERLRARIPAAYNPRAAEESEIDLQNFSVQAEGGFESMATPVHAPYRSKPKKGVLGMEVSLAGEFVQIVRLALGGACEQAGLLEGDIIRTWNGKLIKNQTDFIRATSVCGAGIPINVEVHREGVRGLLTFEVIPKRKA